jgi:hypothetical protein
MQNIKYQEPKIMGYAELIQQRLQNLSQEKQAEIYDFVEFLAARSSNASLKAEHANDWTDTEFSRLSIAQAMRGLEDDPVTYTLNDVKERWQ